MFNYITNYSRYKIDAVQLAIAEFQSRGFVLSDDELSSIESFFSLKSNQVGRPLNFNYSLSRLLSYAIFAVGILISVVIYITVRSPMQNPLGYDPIETKKYLRELEFYGGKSNMIATEFREWFVGLWQGQNLSYTVAFITVIISIILWFIGSRRHSDSDKKLENPNGFYYTKQ